MMERVYSASWYLLLPFLFGRLYWRGRLAPAYRKRWAERLALGYGKPGSNGCVWIHAVSVGEFLAAAPLIDALMERHPDTPILVTTTTPTGSERVTSRFGERVMHVYCPWELPGALTRFMQCFRPKLGIIMETELWPNLTKAAESAGCTLLLANGRLSEKSYRGYAKLPSLVEPLVQRFAVLSVQTEADAAHFKALGASAEAVHVNGSIKFDVSLSDSLREQAAEERRVLGDRPVWIVASSHEQEETIILDAQRRLLETQSDVLLLWVPRHPERFSAVASQAKAAGLSVAQRSRQDTVQSTTQVYLADTMGELLLLYGVADVALVAGSLVAPLGGHNLLEPAAWGKPVLSGTHLHNFTEIAALLSQVGGLTKVNGAQELAGTVAQLFTDTDKRNALGKAALGVVEANRGATARLLAQIEALWPPNLG